MNDDMKRLCEAAMDGFVGHRDMDTAAESVVRAVLTELQKPSDGIRRALFEAAEDFEPLNELDAIFQRSIGSVLGQDVPAEAEG